MKIKFRYRDFIAILFFIFFTMPILSPSINENTIYINWFIPLLDFNFINKILKMKINKKYVYLILLLILSILLFGKIMVAVKLLFLIETILYLFYCKENNNFSYLYTAVNLNIIIGILQYVLYYISPILSYAIGPSNVAKQIWGGTLLKLLQIFMPYLNLCEFQVGQEKLAFLHP